MECNRRHAGLRRTSRFLASGRIFRRYHFSEQAERPERSLFGLDTRDFDPLGAVRIQEILV
jgi:hypothetical protein